jgi:CHAT domain-containing protein
VRAWRFVYRLPSQDVIDKALKEFLPTLRAPLFGMAETDEHVRLAKELYLTLLGPVRDLIRGKHHIVIVPDGELYYLPFEALIATDEKVNGPEGSLASQPYLGKAYSFSYAPSASVLVTIEHNARKDGTGRAANQRPLLAFADPTIGTNPTASQVAFSTRGAYEEMGIRFNRLPYSGDEVLRVAAVYGIEPDSSSINLGDKATKKRLEQLDLTQYRILHFATHALVGDEVKWINQPALILSPEGTGKGDDGVLKMSDIFNLRLNADLVVLSACETAGGQMSRGEGIVGLTTAFLFAGSRSVVASLWDVNDESTSLFMESFYRGLKAGLTKADALRRARNEIMQARAKSSATEEPESLASPYFWAPFILIGSWN